jgi:hypothetical protein
MRRANESYTAAAQASIMAHDKQRQDLLTAKSNILVDRQGITGPPHKYRKMIGGGKEPSLKGTRPFSNVRYIASSLLHYLFGAFVSSSISV